MLLFERSASEEWVSSPRRRAVRALSFGMRILAILLVVALAGCGSKDASRFHGVVFDPPEPAPAVMLTRGDGSTFDLRQQHGAVVLLFFGYTHCPDVCPTTLSDWVKIKRGLGRDADRVRFVFITVDPARDTPRATQQYAAGFDRDFIGLSGDSAQVAQAQTLMHVTSSREYGAPSGEYTMSHAAQWFVVDREGRVRLLYPPGTPVDGVVADLKRLLRA